MRRYQLAMAIRKLCGLAVALGGTIWVAKGIGDFLFATFQDLPRISPVESKEPASRAPDSEELDFGVNTINPIIVAIIDTGVDRQHPEILPYLWKNPKDNPDNGRDDDKNGFVDDFHGWNFADSSKDIRDHHGHGTHIAGIILRSSGYDPRVKLMILKYYNPAASGAVNLENSLRCLRYAIEMGAHIINYSGGGTGFSADEKTLLLKANAKGILVIAAAGNERSNADLKPFYPASYGLPNIVSVAALNDKSGLISSSNYGRRSVDLAAPGLSVLSTLPDGSHGLMTGTSQATAAVTGLAARLMAKFGTEASMIRHRLLHTVEETPDLENKLRSGGRADEAKALQMREQGRNFADETVSNLSSFDPELFTPQWTRAAEDFVP